MRQRERDALGDGDTLELNDVVVHFRIFQSLNEIVTLRRVVEPNGEARPDALDRVEFVVEGHRDLDVGKAAAPKGVALRKWAIDTIFEPHDPSHVHARETHLVPGSVSYTHLRAHETGRQLVCRLLLEKKKTKRTITRKICLL